MSCLLVTSMLIGGVKIHGESFQSERSSERVEPRSVRDYVSPGVGYTNILLPDQTLRFDELSQWRHVLRASDAQQHFIKTAYEDFVHAWNDRMDDLVPQYLEGSADLTEVRISAGHQSREFLESLTELLQHRRRVVRELQEVERTFLDSLVPILNEEQVRRLAVIRSRVAMRWYRSVPIRTRGLDVDLYGMWLSVDHEMVEHETHVQVDRILIEQEIALTSYMRQHSRLHIDNMKSGTRRLVRVATGEMGARESINETRRGHARRADIGRRARDSNQSALHAIVALLPDCAGSELNARFRQQVFPELYPNNTSLDNLLAALEDDAHSCVAGQDLINAMTNEYRREMQRMNVELEKFILDWTDRSAASIDGYQSQLLPGALEPKLVKRTNFSRDMLAKLEQAVGTDELQRHAELIPKEFELAGAPANDAEESSGRARSRR